MNVLKHNEFHERQDVPQVDVSPGLGSTALLQNWKGADVGNCMTFSELGRVQAVSS